MSYPSKPASQEQIALYCFVGETICAVQHVEDALSHSIALKNDLKTPFRLSRTEGDKILKKYRSFTLGQAVKLAKKENLFSKQLLLELDEFLSERNWLVHKSIAQGRDEGDEKMTRHVIHRTRQILSKANRVYYQIEQDMILFSEAKGLDMSKVRAEIKKFYSEN